MLDEKVVAAHLSAEHAMDALEFIGFITLHGDVNIFFRCNAWARLLIF
jgi:hypothetical protein